MSDTSSSDYSDTSGTTDASDTYAQIVVPSYDLADTVVASSTVTTGSSFLRLGSFPDLTTTDAELPGFVNSLALANLVGDATSLASSEASDDPAPAALMDDNEYTGDSTCYLLGFTDDTRVRPSGGTTYVDWVSVTDTTTTRKAETARLLTKGGWWDHADGNRVSTTCGDKIEVIQGNYKLVVLGRQEPSASDSTTALLDMSGGHQVTQDAAPNANVMCVEYVQSEGVWTVLEDNGSGNLTSKFHGEHRELYTGSLKESYVGSSPGSYDGSLTRTPDSSNDPVIIEKTWAQSIATYVGSDGKPVPTISTWTGAGEINDVTVAGAVTSTTTAATVTETTLGIKTGIVVGLKTEVVVGASTDIVAGPKLEIGVEKLQFVNFKSVVAAEISEATALETKLASLKTSINSAENRITAVYNVVLGEEKALKSSIAAVSGSVLKVAGDVTKLEESSTKLAAEVAVMAEGVIFL